MDSEAREEGDSFGTVNYIVFTIMLVISAAIGVYFRFTGGRQKTTQEYLLADRDMAVLPVAFSLMASFMSAITLLGVSSENYSYGAIFVLINFSYGLATPIAAYGYLPVFYKLQATSAYEYLERRFGKATRLAASVAFTLQMVLYMGIVLYAPALALSAVTHISRVGALLSVGLVCTFYSTIGGMKAVLITDVFQSGLMYAAVILVIVKGCLDAGGGDEVWRIAREGGRLDFVNFSPDPTERHTFWSLLIGGGFTYLSLYAVNQAQVQRLLTLRSLKRSQAAMWLNWPILTCLSLTTSFSGLVIYSRYYNCDPKLEGRITSLDQLMPIFVMDSMGNIPGLAGLFVAGIFGGTLSTVSSAVNSLAAVTMEDYVKPLLAKTGRPPMSDRKGAIWTQVVVLLYGLVCIGMAYVAENLGGVLQASLTIFGVVGGPLLALFTLGMFVWVAEQTGAITGLVTGLSISLWIGFGRPKPPPPYLPVSIEGCNATLTTLLEDITLPFSDALSSSKEEEHYFYLYRLSYLWVVVIGFVITILVGTMASFVKSLTSEERTEKLNPDLFSPWVQRLLPLDKIQLMPEEIPVDNLSNLSSNLSVEKKE